MTMAKKKDPQQQHLYILGGTFIALLALVLFSYFGGREAQSGRGLKGLMLENVARGGVTDVGACATEKCVRFYISPWCKICQHSTPFLKKFKPWLEAQGYDTQIIVGRDKPGAVDEYAKIFGPDTLIDAKGRYPLRGGVPNFSVIDNQGQVLKTIPGVPRIYSEPIRNEYFIETATFLGLS
jgi:hypothetical protein